MKVYTEFDVEEELRTNDRQMVTLASALWRDTYRKDESDTVAYNLVLDALDEAGEEMSRLGIDNEFFSTIESTHALVAAKWIHCGAPKLVTDEKFAAALMCSSVDENLADSLEVPWKSFRVDIPPRLLGYHGGWFDYVLIAFFEFENAPIAHLILNGARLKDDGVYFTTTLAKANSMATLLLDRELQGQTFEGRSSDNESELDGKARCMRMAIRLVVGLLCTLQYSDNFKSVPKKLSDSRQCIRSGPPTHRTFLIGRPIKVDARPAVWKFLKPTSGKRKAPASVQTLVRGHYKRQVIGISKTGRKVIWIEPYWRGPEDAPILSRPFKLGGGTN
jgi:hypothetical protein